jgi:tetratricopeptide (TPR) repeat protein
METLKKATLILSFLFAAYSGSNAQDYAKIQDAFQRSYSADSAKNYKSSLEIMKTVYDAGSYEMNVRMGWISYLAGQFTESVNYYSKAIVLMPYAIEARFGVIYPVSSLGNWNAVKTQYLEILKIDPQNTVANYKLGYIYYTAENYTDAYKCFEKVVNLYPFDYDGVLMFAWTNWRMGKMREAKVLFNKALMMRPNDASAKEGLGLIK